MKIEQAIKEYLIEIEVRQYSPRTIKGYRNNLNLFLRFCHSVGVENVEEINAVTDSFCFPFCFFDKGFKVSQSFDFGDEFIS